MTISVQELQRLEEIRKLKSTLAQHADSRDMYNKYMGSIIEKLAKLAPEEHFYDVGVCAWPYKDEVQLEGGIK